jgi:hypothetical protein
MSSMTRGASSSRQSGSCRTRPASPDVRIAQDDARPELAIRVDRPKAAMLGLTGQRRRHDDSDKRRRDDRRSVPPARQ